MFEMTSNENRYSDNRGEQATIKGVGTGHNTDGRVVVGSDDQCHALHRRLKRIVKARGSLDLQEAAALREAQSIGIWRRFGYASLVDYMQHEMGYTPRAALDRLRVANAIADLPKIADAIEQGDLSFCGARELTRVATPETEATWLGAVQDMNVRQVEAVVSGHRPGDLPTDAPDPRLQLKVLRYEVRPDVHALLRQAQQVIEKERGERLDDSAFLEALARGALDQRAVTKPAGGGTGSVIGTASAADTESAAATNTAATALDHAPYRVAVTVCKDCKRGWQHGGGTVVEMTAPAIERAQCDAQNIGDLESSPPGRATESISKATRRKVHHRDQGRCQVPGCGASHNVDVHHVEHRQHGGGNELSNLLLLCEGHHLSLHDGTLSIVVVNGERQFRREGRNRFTRATRVVETIAELRRRGYKRHEIVAAMELTRTHVGDQDLRQDQWLAIALGFCAKAAAG